MRAASTTVVGETTTFRVTRLGSGEGACSRGPRGGRTDIDRRSRPQVSKSRVCGLRSRVARTVRGVGSFSAAATALSAEASSLANASVAACRLWTGVAKGALSSPSSSDDAESRSISLNRGDAVGLRTGSAASKRAAARSDGDASGASDRSYHGVVWCALGWACWKTYVGLPEGNPIRKLAMSMLGLGLTAAGHHEEALSVQEAELSMRRRVGSSRPGIDGTLRRPRTRTEASRAVN